MQSHPKQEHRHPQEHAHLHAHGPEQHADPRQDSSRGEETRREDEDEHGYRPAQLEQLRVRTPYALEAGKWEVEIVSKFFDFGADEVSGVQAEIEIGLLDNLMFEVEVPAEWVHSDGETTGGISDVDFELKLQLSREADLGVATAVGVEMSLPTGDDDRDLGSGVVGWEVYAAAARDFGKLSLFGEFQAELEEGSAAEYKFNGAIDWAPWEPETRLELGLNLGFGPGEGMALTVIPGFQFEVAKFSCGELEIGLGLPVGLTDEAEDWGVILNLEFEF